jgi:hypothetical protein
LILSRSQATVLVAMRLLLPVLAVLLAGGCLVPPPPGTQAQHPETATSKEAGIVIAKLGEQRQEKGLLPPKVLLEVQEMEEDEVLCLEKGECNGDSAVHRALQKTLWKVRQEGTVVRAWFIATDRLDYTPFPPELLKTKNVRVAVVVARSLPGKSGTYGVLITAEIPGDALEVNR